MDQQNDFYNEAHILVAAVRVLTHQQEGPPSPEEVCGLLNRSTEWGLATIRRLNEMGIIETTGDAFTMRLFVAEHLKLEEIPKGEKKTGFGEELKKFQAGKQDIGKKVESIKADLDRKKQDLFAELQQKIKQSSPGKA